MKTRTKDEQTIIDLKKKYPLAINITYGSNNIVFGFWFDNGENAIIRNFYPLNK